MAQVNPAMIVLARESRGYTQADLANILQISKGKMSKIEHGFLQVSDTLLEEIAQKLDYPAGMFYSTFQPFPAGLPFYRKHKTLPAKQQSKIVAEMNFYRKYLKDLIEEIDITFNKLPECDVEEYGSAEAVAQAVRQYLNLPKNPVQNVTNILEDAGVIIILLDAPTHKFSGASMLLENGNYILFANKNMPADRLRFTLAHELGHLIMHRLPSPNLEDEADRFAAEFLMPTKEIYPSLKELNLPKLAYLKKYWKVSMGAILKHAYNLKAINKRQYEYLWTQMGKAGYRMKEPPELDFPIETPSLLDEIISVHIKDLGYTPIEISQKLQISEKEYRARFLPAIQKQGLRLVKNTSQDAA